MVRVAADPARGQDNARRGHHARAHGGRLRPGRTVAALCRGMGRAAGWDARRGARLTPTHGEHVPWAGRPRRGPGRSRDRGGGRRAMSTSFVDRALPSASLMLTVKVEGAPAVHLVYDHTRPFQETTVTVLDQATSAP